MHARDDDVDLRQQLGFLVEPAVLEDVDLDAREDAHRLVGRGELVVQLRDDVELLAQTLGRESVRDLQAGRVVGEREVVVPDVADALGHGADRVAAVGPVGVHVQVAAQRAPDRIARIGAGLDRVLFERREVRGRPPRERLRDDGRGLLADVLEIAQPPDRGEAPELVLGDVAHRDRGAAEGLHPVARLAAAFEQRRDPIQRLGRIHAATVACGP